MQKRTTAALVAMVGVAALTLASCSSSSAPAEEGTGDLGTITVGYIPAYTDTASTAFLAKNQLEKLGYTVELNDLTEIGILFTGLANGDVDIYPSVWPDITHKTYMEQYGDDLEDLGTFYDQAQNFLAVPAYTDVDSIADLKGNADIFDGTITGIEPSAGLMSQTGESVMPAYGLDDEYELESSSTAAMLTELDSAIAAQEDIVVTMWRPYWANGSYDLKTLEDPKGAMGEPETMHTMATKGFSNEFPEAAEYFTGFSVDDDQWSSLENLVVNEYDDGEENEAIEQWLSENPDAYETEIVE